MRQSAFLAAALLLPLFSVNVAPQSPSKNVDFVTPNIGGIGQLLTATVPDVQVRYGMARLVPIKHLGVSHP
jgi:hypothetical protein